MSDIYDLEQGMTTLTVGKKESITGVLLHAGSSENGDTLDYFAGSKSGNVLEATIPNATQAQAQSILDRLTLRGYQYQPFDSERTVTDPTIEIGDYVTANDNDGIVLGYDINHSRLMAPTLKAPYDEEVNHEFRFETRQQREYKRETKYTRSRLTINADAITAEVARASKREGELSAQLSITADAITSEVTRASNAEGTLRSSIQQNADEISAKVSKQGGSSSTFGWSLTDHDWTISANGKTVLRATINGLDVEGKITATSGYIGTTSAGFEIGSRSISNGMTSRDDTENNGVYIGTNGIALGAGKFKVTANGAVTASNINITGGSISIKDSNDKDVFLVSSSGDAVFAGNVYARNIGYGIDPETGIDRGTMGGGGITPGSINTNELTSPLNSVALGGIGGGIGFNNMNGEITRAFIYGTSGNFTGSLIVSQTLVAYTLGPGGAANSKTISWQDYSYPTGVSVWATPTSTIWVRTDDGGSAQIHTSYNYGGNLTNDGSKFTYLKGG